MPKILTLPTGASLESIDFSESKVVPEKSFATDTRIDKDILACNYANTVENTVYGAANRLFAITATADPR